MGTSTVLSKISQELENIPGIVGVVLGGSRARGTNHPASDIDIGIYYDESSGFNVNQIGKTATKLDDDHRQDLITSLGEWGAWINGGGWIVVEGYHVDLIFRDYKRVVQVIDECMSGKISSHYHAGHPHAYLNCMYMGEIAVCKILSDPTGRIAKLKDKTKPYPKALKDAIIGYFMFEASFSLMFVKDNADKDDISYVTGHCFRTISCLNQVLFAINEEYCINEKKAVRMIENFKYKPQAYKERTDHLFTMISNDRNHMMQAVEILEELVLETERLLKSA